MESYEIEGDYVPEDITNDVHEKSIKAEVLLHIDTEYAITVNPADKYQYFGKEDVHEAPRCDLVNKYFRNLMQDFSINQVEYKLLMECSEPLRGNRRPDKAVPRLHYHGRIYFSSMESIRWFLMYGAGQLAAVCSYSIEPLKDPDGWDAYCNKQAFLKWPKIVSFKYDDRNKDPPTKSVSPPKDDCGSNRNRRGVGGVPPVERILSNSSSVEEVAKSCAAICKRVRRKKI